MQTGGACACKQGVHVHVNGVHVHVNRRCMSMQTGGACACTDTSVFIQTHFF